ncbi:MAG: hypothetical protein DRH08_08515 [Deltaproteobacteria bacterium]|nr:MAG: hypothetical protein DRH08_08515 [Deltaproteobacteria bacterium]
MLENLPWLPYLMPPLLGALIGYVTNYIAIRMLFRPLRPWRLFGIRLPMTPGIIPSKRGELAQRMGEMVGSHLLTADDVCKTLEKPAFHRELKGAVNDKLGAFLDRDLGPLVTLIPDSYQRRFRELVTTVRTKAICAVTDYLASSEYEKLLRGFLQEKGDALLARDLESFLTPARYQSLQNHLDTRLTTILHSPEAARTVERFVDERLERLLQSDRSLRKLLPGDLVEVLLQQLEREVPPLLERFGGLLYDPDFRQRLAERGRQGIESFLDSLGGLAGLLSGFINLDQVYNRIPEFLDKAGEEVSHWLREEKTQQQVASMLRERLEGILDKPLSSFLEKAPYEKVAGARRYLCERSVAAVQSRRTTELLLGFADNGLHRVKDRSFRSLLDENLPENGVERMQKDLGDRLLKLSRSAEVTAAIDTVIKDKLEVWAFQKPMGRLAERLPADVLDELEEGLYRQVGEVLQKEVPPLIETLNVSRMVEDKVNRLDILQVEGLLMGIMQEQFKYINMFGAILGGLIGLINLAVWWMA